MVADSPDGDWLSREISGNLSMRVKRDLKAAYSLSRYPIPYGKVA